MEAKKIAEISGISRNSINKIIKTIRKRIAEFSETENPIGCGEIEIDESYFGARRIRGKRGRGAAGKIPIFGMLKRNGKVFTQIVKNCSAAELIPIIKEQADNNSVIFSDSFRTYDGLADFGYKRHYRIKHGNDDHIFIVHTVLVLCVPYFYVQYVPTYNVVHEHVARYQIKNTLPRVLLR